MTEISTAGGSTFLDVQTHAIDFPGANNFARYDAWRLWPGRRGDLASATARQGHVDRVVAVQATLSLDEVLSPTVRLEQPTGGRANIAFDLASRTLDAEDSAWLTIAGTPAFWTAGTALDTYIGRLSQLRPGGFLVVVARAAIGCPAPGVTADEIQGLARTVRSLSLRVPVVVSHGDLAALPAVAAGATGLGTGWDLRQRVLGGDAFQVSTTVRRRGSRVTHQELMSVLKRREAEALRVRDSALSRRLVPGPHPTGGRAEWVHHVTVLNGIVNRIAAKPAGRARADELRAMYKSASTEFANVERLVRLEFGSASWLTEVRAGLENYARAEGW